MRLFSNTLNRACHMVLQKRREVRVHQVTSSHHLASGLPLPWTAAAEASLNSTSGMLVLMKRMHSDTMDNLVHTSVLLPQARRPRSSMHNQAQSLLYFRRPSNA